MDYNRIKSPEYISQSAQLPAFATFIKGSYSGTMLALNARAWLYAFMISDIENKEISDYIIIKTIIQRMDLYKKYYPLEETLSYLEIHRPKITKERIENLRSLI